MCWWGVSGINASVARLVVSHKGRAEREAGDNVAYAAASAAQSGTVQPKDHSDSSQQAKAERM